MSKLLKEWNRLAFDKGTRSMLAESEVDAQGKKIYPDGFFLYDGSGYPAEASRSRMYHDGWTSVPDADAAREWAKDQLETDYHGRPETVKIEGIDIDGETGKYGYLCRYSSEVGSAGPTIFFCNSKVECEGQWRDSVDAI